MVSPPIKPVKGFRQALLNANNGVCYRCDVPLHLKDVTIDHVIPKASGGTDRGNRAPACAPCNQEKDSRMPTGCELIRLDVINLILDRSKEEFIRSAREKSNVRQK